MPKNYATPHYGPLEDQIGMAKTNMEIAAAHRIQSSSPLDAIDWAVKEQYHKARILKMQGVEPYSGSTNRQIFKAANKVVREHPSFYLQGRHK